MTERQTLRAASAEERIIVRRPGPAERSPAAAATRRRTLELGLAIAVAAKADRGLADGFDCFEGGSAFLLTQHVAQKAAQEADVFLQRLVFCRRAARRTARSRTE